MGEAALATQEFEEWVQEAIDSLPSGLADAVSNVEILIEDSDPERLGLYQGIPLTRRSRGYVWALPDRITIYRGSLERIYGRNRERTVRARGRSCCLADTPVYVRPRE